MLLIFLSKSGRKWEIQDDKFLTPRQAFDDAHNPNSTWQMPLDWDGNAWNGLSHYDDTSISHNVENCNISSLRVRSPFNGYPEKSHVSGIRKEMRE